jgi:catechol 2,3-dioxygenase-like lactoylglutathione lyase family enzyme
MLDHVTIGVSDLERSKAFYDKALKAIGIERLYSEGAPAGETGDDGGEGIHVGFKDDIAGDAPAVPARLEIVNQLVHRTDQHVGALEDFLRTQLGLANSSAAWRRSSVTTTRCISAFSSSRAYRSPATSRTNCIRLST